MRALVWRFILTYCALVAIGSLVAFWEVSQMETAITAPMEAIARALDHVR